MVEKQAGDPRMICMLGLLIFALVAQPASAADAYPVARLSGHVPLGPYLSILEDTSASMDFADVRNSLDRFQNNSQDVPSYGFSSSAFWVKVTLIYPPDSKEIVLLSLDYPLMDFLDFYAPDSLGAYSSMITGYSRPFASRQVKHGKFIFELVPQPGKMVTYYMRLANSDRMEIPLTLWQRKVFLESDQLSQFLNGVFLGLVCSAILLNLLMFITFRDVSYLHYTSFLFFFSFFVATHGGIIYEYFWPQRLEGHNHYIPYAIGGLLFSLVLLAQSYLSTKERLPRCHTVLRYLGGIQLFSIVLCLVLPRQWATILEVLMTIVTMGSVFLVSVMAAPTSRIARYFFLAWIIALLTGVFYSLKAFGVLELAWFQIEVLAGVWVLQFIILSLGLGERLLQARQEKEEFQRRAIENLQKANRLKDEFLANTSHELRTPLNGIIGIAESLIDGAAGPLGEEVQENLHIVISSGKRLSNLVNDILDISKLKNGEIVLKENVVDLRQVGDIVVSMLGPLAQRKSLELVNHIPRDLPFAKADEDRLQQILHNLVGNGIKFTQYGQVELSAETSGAFLRICVQDTGIGVAPEKCDVIFESFRQGDASVARTHGGTGLGLSLCRQLVVLHGGSIWVESQEGVGSRFYFTLPMAPEGAKPSYTEMRPMQPVASVLHQEDFSLDSIKSGSTLGEVRILAVDDEPINLKVLVNQLTSAGYRVATASNGKDALDYLETQAVPDMVLLDVMMPRMSGYEVCRKLRERFDMSILPVIMLTAKNQVADLVEGLESGANDYLTKPFSKAELLARIRTHISLAKINQSYARFVPQQFLKQLGRDDIVAVQLGDHVERNMAVFFSDIRNFTSISETMSAEENFNFLNSYLGRVGPIISARQGFIDKYVGDGMMALFPESVEHAVDSAIAIVQEMSIYNRHRARCGYQAIQVGIGIHTGSLMLGTIGEKNRMDGTVIADVVNLASRLEQLNKVFGSSIIVSQDVVDALPQSHRQYIRYLGCTKVRGKQVPVDVYDVFAGDLPGTIQLREATRSLFESAVRALHHENMAEARTLFQKVLAQDPEDSAAQSYLSRCK